MFKYFLVFIGLVITSSITANDYVRNENACNAIAIGENNEVDELKNFSLRTPGNFYLIKVRDNYFPVSRRFVINFDDDYYFEESTALFCEEYRQMNIGHFDVVSWSADRDLEFDKIDKEEYLVITRSLDNGRAYYVTMRGFAPEKEVGNMYVVLDQKAILIGGVVRPFFDAYIEKFKELNSL